MNHLCMIALSLLCVVSEARSQERIFKDTLWQTFEPGVISLPETSEYSPSVSADGQTLVFVRRYKTDDKKPFIAELTDSGWIVKEMSWLGDFFKLSINDQGNSIFYKQEKEIDGIENSFVYKVVKKDNQWSRPVEIKTLRNINAAYFDSAPDGTLYFFANGPVDKGIYKAEPNDYGSYGKPEWLGYKLSTEGVTNYDPLLNDDETKMILTKGGMGEETVKKIGPNGFYVHKKTADGWSEGEFIEELPRGWGANIFPDGKFLFVDDGDFQIIDIDNLNIKWK